MNLKNFFTLFNLTPKVFIDHDALDSAYQKIQEVVHPDQQKDIFGSSAAALLSSKIAKAYDALKDPLGSIDHFLFIKGLPSLKESSTTSTDMDILEETLDFQEKLQNGTICVLDIKKDIEHRLIDLAISLEDAFKKDLNEYLQKYAIRFFYLYRFLVRDLSKK